MTAECPYTLQRDALFPKKLPIPMGDLDPYLTQGSVGPPESSTQTASRSVHLFFFAGLTSVTDRQADRPTDHAHAIRSVTIGRVYVGYVVLRYGLITGNRNGNYEN